MSRSNSDYELWEPARVRARVPLCERLSSLTGLGVHHAMPYAPLIIHTLTRDTNQDLKTQFSTCIRKIKVHVKEETSHFNYLLKLNGICVRRRELY